MLLTGLLAACAGAPPTPDATGSTTAPIVTQTGTDEVLADPAGNQLPPASPVDVDTRPPRVTVTAVGDIMMGGTAAPEFRKFGYDYAFENVRPWLATADVALGNLEGPLTNRGDLLVEKKYRFRSPPGKVAPALAAAGFDVLSLANNHSLDWGVVGMQDTISAVRQHGMEVIGAGNNAREARTPVIVERKGIKMAFLGYTLTFPEEFWAGSNRPGAAFGHETHVRADVQAARKKADIVIVSFHWGREGSTELRPYQPQLAHAAIDAGAALVVGHHPHILQGVERYKDGLIFYSLGNFVFGSYSYSARVSAMARVSFEAGKVREAELIPINVFNPEVVFQPKVLQGAVAGRVIADLDSLSKPLATRVQFNEARSTGYLTPDVILPAAVPAVATGG